MHQVKKLTENCITVQFSLSTYPRNAQKYNGKKTAEMTTTIHTVYENCTPCCDIHLGWLQFINYQTVIWLFSSSDHLKQAKHIWAVSI